MRGFWFLCGWGSVILGAIGVLLPLLPTVPFLLLAAFCFAKSSQRTHDWLINHKIFGPPIQDWRQHGAIRKQAKILASLCILLTFILSLVLHVSGWILGIQVVVLSAVAVFIWTRPNA